MLHSAAMTKGMWYGIGAYAIWGVLPIFWKSIQQLSAFEILGHRIVWSWLLLALLLSARRRWPGLQLALRQPRTWRVYGTTAVLLAINWSTYIWAVNSGHIVESSLGYFINPLVNVLLGVVLLRERLRPWQIVAVASALAGVVYLTFNYGRLPWIALTLAFSFGFYGLLRKQAPLSSTHGLTLETGILFVPALAYLGWLQAGETAVFLHTTPLVTLLVPLSGVATALPLLLFGAAAPLLTLTTLGILQYLAPTLQFLIGVLIYGEPFDRADLLGFSLIWLALIVYTAERILHHRRHARVPVVG